MIKQISVFLENRSGQLVQITSALSDAGIDLRALNIAETAHYGVLRLITSDSAAALQVLADHGFVITATPVVAVSIPDVPGALNKILYWIAEAGIDIEYMYSIFGQKGGYANMIFRVNDIDVFEKLLLSHSIHIATDSELGIC